MHTIATGACMPYPSLKPTEQPVALLLPTGEGLAAQGVAIVEAVAAGTLAPGST